MRTSRRSRWPSETPTRSWWLRRPIQRAAVRASGGLLLEIAERLLGCEPWRPGRGDRLATHRRPTGPAVSRRRGPPAHRDGIRGARRAGPRAADDQRVRPLSRESAEVGGGHARNGCPARWFPARRAASLRPGPSTHDTAPRQRRRQQETNMTTATEIRATVGRNRSRSLGCGSRGCRPSSPSARPVVVAVDDSPAAGAAVREGVRLAGARGSGRLRLRPA